MPLTIPYDPSFTLGSIIPQDKVDHLLAIASAQVPVNDAEAALNSLISLKRSIDMTISELEEMGVDTKQLKTLTDQSTTLSKDIVTAANNYASQKTKFISAVTSKKKNSAKSPGMLSAEVESPMDYARSVLKKMPISADSLNMNVQYFSFEGNKQSANSMAASISSYLSGRLKDIWGPKKTAEVKAAAQGEIASQYARNDIQGTLVFSINCTHKTAQIFAPFILDADKAVTAWNKLCKTRLDTTKPGQMVELMKKAVNSKNAESFNILSGATYGSSFIGMVHVLNTTETQTTQDMAAIAASVQMAMTKGSFLQEETGGFGVESTFSDSAKHLLSTNIVQSHCSAITMGIIPSIKSNKVDFAVKQFTTFDPANSMEKLANLQNATASANNSLDQAANAARTGQEMISLDNAKIKATLTGLKDLDHQSNQIIDINSLMTAMDDYIQKCISGGENLGIPINFFLKPITLNVVVRAWLNKYFPKPLVKSDNQSTTPKDNSNPDNSNPDNSNPDNSNPDNSNPDNSDPDNSNPDNSNPDNS